MSWQATIWAASLPHSRVAHVPFRVLMLLADHAHDDGTATWRSVSSMAATLEVSHRTIQRAIADLKDQHLIRYGDQRLLSHLPTGRGHGRPMVYDLVMSHQTWQPTTLDQVDDLDNLGVSEVSPQESDDEELSTGVTTGVVSLKEEPPLDITKVLNATHTVPVTPERPTQCPTSRNRIHDYQQPSGRCHCGLRDDGNYIDPLTGKPRPPR